MKRASDAEGLVGSQALDLPCLHATLAGARTLGRPQLPNQTFSVPQAPPEPQASSSSERNMWAGLFWSIMTSHMEQAHLSFRCTGSGTMLNCSWPCPGAQMRGFVRGAAPSPEVRTEPGTHRTPGGRKPSVLAVLPLTGLQGRGPGQVGTVARRSHVELSPQFGHTDDISALRAGATV